MDINTAPLPGETFDLVVNYAASHHIARLDRVFRALCSLLPASAWMVSYDYVGPHRNQWDSEAWEAAQLLNSSLPEAFQQDLRYPHLPTMLRMDPTEAVHSELVMTVYRRYFAVEEWAPVGGALAYLLLTHNERLFRAPDDHDREMWVSRILQADEAFLRGHPDSTLFAYFSGRPKKLVLKERDQLARWTAEEEALERRADAHGGEYYELTPLQLTYQLQEAKVQTRRQGVLSRLIRRPARTDMGRRLRASRFGSILESWARRRMHLM